MNPVQLLRGLASFLSTYLSPTLPDSLVSRTVLYTALRPSGHHVTPARPPDGPRINFKPPWLS